MPLSPGTRLGRYEVVRLLGAGGMGEVYLAKDTQLDRTVAIKVLPEHLSGNPELRQRFEREARAVSSLNHPHICTLYDVGHEGDVHYLVMEHLEGETLVQRLRKGALPTDEALSIAIQIADALDKAHRKGVVHRDLKPGNIMLTKLGAKLLDFGLAKQTADAGPSMSSAALTQTSPLTAEGTIVGTFQYMAPEQLEGKEADARTDLFAFGAVLYEMVTGKAAFEGKSQASLIHAIMGVDPPPVSTLRPMSPPALDRVVKRCLAKDPDERWQSANDLTSELKWVAGAGSQAGVAVPVAARRKMQSRVAWSLVALLAAVSAFVSIAYYRDVPAEVRTYRTSVLVPEGAKLGRSGTGAEWGSIELSPNGRHLVMLVYKDGKNMLSVRSLDELDARPLAGTEGASFPFWSPDSQFVGFFADGKLKRIPRVGGPVLTLCETPTPGFGGTWSQEDVIIFAGDYIGHLWKVSAAGGEPTQVTRLDESRREESHYYPHFLPDGRHFLYSAWIPSNEFERGRGLIVAGSIDYDEREPIVEISSNVAYASNHLLFSRGQTLMAQRFDLDRLELVGDAFPIAEDVQYHSSMDRAAFSVSRNGVLAYQMGGAQVLSNLVWYERSGTPVGNVGEPARYEDVSLSPDGTRAAVSILNNVLSNVDLWMMDLARGTRTRFTFDDAGDAAAQWSPDGTRILFSSLRRGQWSLFEKPANGATEAVFLQAVENVFIGCDSWSPGGQHVICHGLDMAGKTSFDVYLLSLSEDAEVTPLIQTQFSEQWPQFSPDGLWLAYTSDESGVEEVYVRPFPLRGGKWQVSTTGGTQPRWGPDSKELFYMAPRGKLMVAQLRPGEKSLNVGQIDSLFQTGFTPPRTIHTWRYDVTSDGQRFLIIENAEQEEVSPVTLVINWNAELEE